ncbi:hypothetical protein ACFW6F_11200 [Streptomyces sp. NPDC058746]|uniref:hypothetical protein n=1 Tax=Streptomyces sp. NPDC058746 TaxID=3346622 RepID=UPI0036C71BD4
MDAAVASRTSDARHLQLDDHAQGGALRLLQHMMEQARKKGTIGSGDPALNPAVVNSSPDKIELVDCVDGTKWVQRGADSSSQGTPGGHYRTEATVVRTADKWTVSELYWEEAGSCG